MVNRVQELASQALQLRLPVELRRHRSYLVKTPLSLHYATLKVDHEVTVPDRGQAVSDGDSGDRASQFMQSLGEDLFGLGV